MSANPLRSFFLPALTSRFLMRAALVTALAFILFRFVLQALLNRYRNSRHHPYHCIRAGGHALIGKAG